MKKLFAIVFTLLLMIPSLPVNAASLVDVNNHWAKEVIIKATEAGWINGYPDGSFKPDANISRAEFVKSLVAALKLKPIEGDTVFVDDDIDGGWYNKYVNAALQKGIIKKEDYKEYKFEPKKPITRQEIAIMTVRALDKEKDATSKTALDKIVSKLKDLGVIPEEVRGYVKIANDLGIIRGYADGTFGPHKNATRAEAVVMVQRTLDKTGSSKNFVYPKTPEEMISIINNLTGFKGVVTKAGGYAVVNLKGTDNIDDYTFSISYDDTGYIPGLFLSFGEFNEDEQEFMKEFLKLFYPKSYEKAYKDCLFVNTLDTKDKRNNIEIIYDNRKFRVFKPFDNLGIGVQIGK